MAFDSLSFKSKHSFLSEFFDDIDKLNNPNPKNESTKEKKYMCMMKCQNYIMIF